MSRLTSHIVKISLRPIVVLMVGAAGAVSIALFGSTSVFLTYIALLSVGLLALLTLIWQRASSLSEHADFFSTPLALAQDPQLLELYRSVSASMRRISSNLDPIYQDLSRERLKQLSEEASQVAHGRIVFTGTESWRMAYEQLLRSRGLYRYRSVSFVKTENYWQDEPGRRSLDLNMDLQGNRLNIERVAIIPDRLWPESEQFPVEPLFNWFDQQHRHGIALKLVRRSVLDNEPDLVLDAGIYGNRAVGVQELDDQGRTIRFTLSFDFAEVLSAEQRWEKLDLYAVSYRELLDRSPNDR